MLTSATREAFANVPDGQTERWVRRFDFSLPMFQIQKDVDRFLHGMLRTAWSYTRRSVYNLEWSGRTSDIGSFVYDQTIGRVASAFGAVFSV